MSPPLDDDPAMRRSLYLEPEPYTEKWPLAASVSFIIGVSVGLWVALLLGVFYVAHLAKTHGLLG